MAKSLFLPCDRLLNLLGNPAISRKWFDDALRKKAEAIDYYFDSDIPSESQPAVHFEGMEHIFALQELAGVSLGNIRSILKELSAEGEKPETIKLALQTIEKIGLPAAVAMPDVSPFCTYRAHPKIRQQSDPLFEISDAVVARHAIDTVYSLSLKIINQDDERLYYLVRQAVPDLEKAFRHGAESNNNFALKTYGKLVMAAIEKDRTPLAANLLSSLAIVETCSNLPLSAEAESTAKIILKTVQSAIAAKIGTRPDLADYYAQTPST